MTRSDLEGLRAKYEEMLRLRLAHDAGDPVDPRRAMAALASRFPGALREIDDLPLDSIRGRIDALRAAEDAPDRAPPWMRAMHRFHVLTRGALCAKRWLAERSRAPIDDGARAAFEREASDLCWGDDALAWSTDLARVASPPRGRVTELVYERIARELGTTETEARLLVFGMSRRERKTNGA